MSNPNDDAPGRSCKRTEFLTINTTRRNPSGTAKRVSTTYLVSRHKPKPDSPYYTVQLRKYEAVKAQTPDGKIHNVTIPTDTVYSVTLTQDGPVCDCPDFIMRRDGSDPHGCKHIAACNAQKLLPDLKHQP